MLAAELVDVLALQALVHHLLLVVLLVLLLLDEQTQLLLQFVVLPSVLVELSLELQVLVDRAVVLYG